MREKKGDQVCVRYPAKAKTAEQFFIIHKLAQMYPALQTNPDILQGINLKKEKQQEILDEWENGEMDEAQRLTFIDAAREDLARFKQERKAYQQQKEQEKKAKKNSGQPTQQKGTTRAKKTKQKLIEQSDSKDDSNVTRRKRKNIKSIQNYCAEKKEESGVASSRINIFTPEFLAHNKRREEEWRRVRRETALLEEENSLQSKHVENLTAALRANTATLLAQKSQLEVLKRMKRSLESIIDDAFCGEFAKSFTEEEDAAMQIDDDATTEQNQSHKQGQQDQQTQQNHSEHDTKQQDDATHKKRNEKSDNREKVRKILLSQFTSDSISDCHQQNVSNFSVENKIDNNAELYDWISKIKQKNVQEGVSSNQEHHETLSSPIFSRLKATFGSENFQESVKQIFNSS